MTAIPTHSESARTPAPVHIPGLPVLYVLLVIAWWPAGAWWRSDDLLAIHYAEDFSRALSDFVGPQYGLQGVAEFWRPLITLSFAIEEELGANAFVSHLINTLVHAGTACLVAWLGVRLLGPFRGFMAGLLWGLAPTHIGSIFWAVGRVDVFATFFTLASFVAVVRRVDGRKRTGRRSEWIWFILALGCKEVAMVLPAAAALVAFAAAKDGRRFRTALSTWPLWVLLAGYVVLRFALFGGMGGYSSTVTMDTLKAQWEQGSIWTETVLPWGEGLMRGFGTVLNPLRKAPIEPENLVYAGYVPVLLAVGLYFAAKRKLLFGLTAIGFVLTAAPFVHVWAVADELPNLRLFYLPTVAICLFLGGAGVVPAILTLVVWVPPTLEWHRQYFDQYRDCKAVHQQIIATATELPDQPLFLAGLRRSHEGKMAVGFKEAVDRLCQTPFVEEGRTRRTLALRPLGVNAIANRVPYGEQLTLPFDDAMTLAFAPDGTSIGQPPEIGSNGTRLPDLELSTVGLEYLASRQLIQLKERPDLARIESSEAIFDGALATKARVTLFTGCGYLSTFVPLHATEDQKAAVWISEVLLSSYLDLAADAAQDRVILKALEVPTALDLDLGFPTLVEFGRNEEIGGSIAFVPLAANRKILTLRFDRELPKFLYGKLEDE